MARSFRSPTAQIDPTSVFGSGTSVWDFSKIRENAKIGSDCVIGQGCFVDVGVTIGDNCKVQNNAQIFSPASLGDGVFVGPGSVLTNDRNPRAVRPDGSLKRANDWCPSGVIVRNAASIGAGAICVGPITIGEWAMVAAGATVTRDVPAYSLVGGTPAIHVGWVGQSGFRLEDHGEYLLCPVSGEKYTEESDGLRLVVA